MSIVLSVDPGVMTGWATWSDRLLVVGQAEFDPFVRYVVTLAEEDQLHVIVCERYTITGETLKKSRQSASLEVIGFLKSVGVVYDIPVILQTPADAKRFATDAKLTAAGWKLPSTQDHANDALRHLMLYLVKERMMEPPRV